MWYEEALLLASKVGVDESKANTLKSGRQMTRATPPPPTSPLRLFLNTFHHDTT